MQPRSKLTSDEKGKRKRGETDGPTNGLIVSTPCGSLYGGGRGAHNNVGHTRRRTRHVDTLVCFGAWVNDTRLPSVLHCSHVMPTSGPCRATGRTPGWQFPLHSQSTTIASVLVCACVCGSVTIQKDADISSRPETQKQRDEQTGRQRKCSHCSFCGWFKLTPLGGAYCVTCYGYTRGEKNAICFLTALVIADFVL